MIVEVTTKYHEKNSRDIFKDVDDINWDHQNGLLEITCIDSYQVTYRIKSVIKVAKLTVKTAKEDNN